MLDYYYYYFFVLVTSGQVILDLHSVDTIVNIEVVKKLDPCL